MTAKRGMFLLGTVLTGNISRRSASEEAEQPSVERPAARGVRPWFAGRRPVPSNRW
jgi:hypothetical protein